MRSIGSALTAIQGRIHVALDHGAAGVELIGRQPRGGPVLYGRPSVIFGLPVSGIGLAMLAAAAGFLPYRLADGSSAPTWLLALIGGLLAFAGTSALVGGFLGRRRAARIRRLRATQPDEPWRWDHPWNERGATDDAGRRTRRWLEAALVIGVMLAPLHWIGFFVPGDHLAIRVFVLLSDVALLAVIGRAGYLLARRVKYGIGRAIFGRFPFRPGTTLELQVEAPAALPQHALPTATLRCVQERHVIGKGVDGEGSGVVCFEIYRDTTRVEVAGAGRRTLRVRFDLPPDVPVTDLSSSACRYWEVDVEATTDGVDYSARFLVPVY